jgi:hypothetical protein
VGAAGGANDDSIRDHRQEPVDAGIDRLHDAEMWKLVEEPGQSRRELDAEHNQLDVRLWRGDELHVVRQRVQLAA